MQEWKRSAPRQWLLMSLAPSDHQRCAALDSQPLWLPLPQGSVPLFGSQAALFLAFQMRLLARWLVRVAEMEQKRLRSVAQKSSLSPGLGMRLAVQRAMSFQS